MHFTRSLAVLASVALVNGIPVPQDDGTTTTTSPTTGNSTSNAIKLVSESDFCLFLPPQPGLEVATNEDNGIPFCSNGSNDVSGAQPFPNGFITVAHFQQNDTYQQVTGYMNPSAYQLSTSDQGGQYDNHGNGKPVGASCQGYSYFVSLIEPANNRFCIRCCQNVDDCNTGRSGYGCLRVIPGDYSQADGTQPSDAGVASTPLPTGTDTAAQPTDSNAPPTDPTAGGDPTADGTNTDDGTHANGDVNTLADELPNSWADENLNAGVNGTDSNPDAGNTDTGDVNGTNSTAPVTGIVSSEFPTEVTSLQALLANGTSVQDIQQSFQLFIQGLESKYPNAAAPLQQLTDLTGNFTTTDEWQNFVQTLQTKISNAGNGGAGTGTEPTSLPPTPTATVPNSDVSNLALPTDIPTSSPSSSAAPQPVPSTDPTTNGDVHDNVWVAEDDVTGDLNNANPSDAPSDAPTASLPTSAPTDTLTPSATPTSTTDPTQPLTAEQLDQELNDRFDSFEQKIMDELHALLGNSTSTENLNDHSNQAAW